MDLDLQVFNFRNNLFMQQAIYYAFLFALIITSGYVSYSQDTKKEEVEFEFKRTADIYDLGKEASLHIKVAGTEDNLERKKKGKKGEKKGDKNTPFLDTDSLDFYPEPNIKPNSPVRPPLFPCDPPECIILQDTLPGKICNNECEEGFKCQGRKDTRIEDENIAVCVPDGT